MILHLHIYHHFTLRIARHAVYVFLISYFLDNPFPALKLVNDPSLLQLQEHGTNYPLLCANVRGVISLKLHSRPIFLQIILTFDDYS